jgi:hypothetical protein
LAINYLDLVFKTLMNRRVTDSDGKYYFNEFGDETLNVHLNEIWADTIDEDPTISLQMNIVEYRELFVMTEDPTVPNQESWYAEEEGMRLRDWVPDKYGLDYKINLFDADDNEIFPTNDCEWFFNHKTGILTFNRNVESFRKPFKISCYRYIGKKGLPESSYPEVPEMPEGIVGIHLFPLKNTPYNKTVQFKIPTSKGMYSKRINLADYPTLAGREIELAEYSIGANRFSEGDYIDLHINGLKVEDTWYTRETPEKVGFGNGGVVYTLPPNSIIDLDFYNESGINKTIWFKIKTLYTS